MRRDSWRRFLWRYLWRHAVRLLAECVFVGVVIQQCGRSLWAVSVFVGLATIRFMVDDFLTWARQRILEEAIEQQKIREAIESGPVNGQQIMEQLRREIDSIPRLRWRP